MTGEFPAQMANNAENDVIMLLSSGASMYVAIFVHFLNANLLENLHTYQNHIACIN